MFFEIYIIYLTFKFNKGTNVKINVFSFKVEKSNNLIFSFRDLAKKNVLFRFKHSGFYSIQINSDLFKFQIKK